MSSPPSLLEQKSLPTILRLAAPTTGVMLIGAVSNILYAYFVSRLGADAIAAVSLVFPVSMVMMTLMGGGIGAGISSAVARSLGAGRPDEARAVAEHALLITAAMSVLATLGMELFCGSLFSLMGGRDAVLAQATQFARILFGGLTITFFVATMDSLMRAEGNARIPAMCGALSLLLQIVFTPLFMFGFGLGLAGAPLAAIAGQLIGLLPRLRYVFGGKGTIHPRLYPGVFALRHVGEIFRVGVPASLSALIHYVGMMVLTGVFGHFGVTHLAAYGLCTRLDFIIFTLGYGVATATLTLVGMAAGARRPDLIERYVRQSALLVAAWVLLPTLIVVTFPDLWFGMFSDDPEIHAVGSGYFRVVGPTYLFAATSMVVASSFQGLRRATIPLMTMSLRVTAVLLLSIAAVRFPNATERPVYFIIAAGNVLSNVLLVMSFRRAVRALQPVAVATLLLALLGANSIAAEPPPRARFFFSGDGQLSMSHAHFSEKLAVRYRGADGTYDLQALAQVTHFFRSREDGKSGEISLRTLELIDFIEDRFRPKRMVLASAYRSPEFNENLRSAGARAAQSSLHTEGLAADIAFEGLDQKKLWMKLRELKLGGVGYYRKDGFLHVDSGRPRFWEPQTSKVEQKLSSGNAKVFARTEYDRYDELDGVVIRLHSVTALPLLVARKADFGDRAVELAPFDSVVRVDGDCLRIDDPADAYKLRVIAPSIDPRQDRTPIRLHTCAPRVEATPESFETNPLESMP